MSDKPKTRPPRLPILRTQSSDEILKKNPSVENHGQQRSRKALSVEGNINLGLAFRKRQSFVSHGSVGSNDNIIWTENKLNPRNTEEHTTPEVPQRVKKLISMNTTSHLFDTNVRTKQRSFKRQQTRLGQEARYKPSQTERESSMNGSFSTSAESNIDTNKIDATDGEVDDNFETGAIEVAAYAHLQEWVQNAELAHAVLAKKFDKKHKGKFTLDLTAIFCCCAHCCKSEICKFSVDVKWLWKSCPGGICCSNRSKPPKFSDSKKMGAFAERGYAHAKRQEQLYALCCCGKYVHLNVMTAPFIWYNLPMRVVVNRIRLIFTVFSELVSMFLKLLFYFSVVSNWLEEGKDNQSLGVGTNFLVVITIFMVSPHILHILWQGWAPGYSLRSTKRKKKAALWSGIPFMRPIYELLWASRFYQMFPYVTIRDQGWIVADNGMHERFMTWRNLQVSCREIPIYIMELYFLAQFFPFWKVDGVAKVTDDIFSGSFFKNESMCWTLDVNTNTIFMSFLVSLVTSGITMVDQIEREMPFGAWSRAVPHLLSDTCCSTAALFWNIVFVLVVFVDLFLKVLVLLPLILYFGSSSLFVIFIILSSLQGILIYFFLAEKNAYVCGSGRDGVITSDQLAFRSPRKQDDDIVPETRTRTLQKERQRRNSNTYLVSGKVPTRGTIDAFDKGLHLDSLERMSTPCCCCYCEGSYRDIWGPIIESLPFVLQGVWVDLPYSMKWLRLGKKTKESASIRFFLVSSLKSILIISVLFAYNLHVFQDTWENALVTCNNNIGASCMAQFSRVKAGEWHLKNKSKLSTEMKNVSLTEDVVLCPPNFRASLNDYTHANQSVKASMLESTWMVGACFNSVKGIACVPEMEGLPSGSNSVSVSYWQVMSDSHAFPTNAYGKTNGFGTVTIVFFVLLSMKALLLLIVWQQFYCISKERRGRLDCCWLPFIKICGKFCHCNRQLNSSEDVGKKLKNSLFRLKARKLWKSEVRARDIQLMLRVCRIMPSWRDAQNSTQDDVEHVQIAKYVLGSGGFEQTEMKSLEEMLSSGSTELPEVNKTSEKNFGGMLASDRAELDTAKGNTIIKRIHSMREYTEKGNATIGRIPSMKQYRSWINLVKEMKSQESVQSIECADDLAL